MEVARVDKDYTEKILDEDLTLEHRFNKQAILESHRQMESDRN